LVFLRVLNGGAIRPPETGVIQGMGGEGRVRFGLIGVIFDNCVFTPATPSTTCDIFTVNAMTLYTAHGISDANAQHWLSHVLKSYMA
jgi:hypothetical protein